MNCSHTCSSYVLKQPLWIESRVVAGFGRGSKQLGIPTANIEEAIVNQLDPNLLHGIYYGLARVNKGPIYRMVMSIGWNPFYQNEKRSAEIHILHQFEDDFHGEKLKIAIIGYIRAEKNYECLDDLIKDIHRDISFASSQLAGLATLKDYTNASFFENARLFNEF